MFFGKASEMIKLKAALRHYKDSLASGEYSVVPRVFRILAEGDAVLQNAAADALRWTLGKMTFEELARIDRQMRQGYPSEWGVDWHQHTIDSFLTLSMTANMRRAVVTFASFCPNGFIREQAVRMMKDFADTLAFALLRLNDWVPQVRDAAKETVDYRLTHPLWGELIAALPFADKLRRAGKAGDSHAHINRIYAALATPENAEELTAGLESDNIQTRRMCIDALFASENPDFNLAFDRLRREAEPPLRADIFRLLQSAGQNMDAAAAWLLRDSNPRNRMQAFRYICENRQGEALQTVHHLLLDKNAAVRENARDYVSANRPGFDYSAFYRARLADCAAPAIFGLGEVGKAEDAAAIEGYLDAPQSRTVQAAMTSLMRLDKTKYAPAIAGLLADERPGVVRVARNLLVKAAADYGRIMEIFRCTSYNNTKLKCLSILLTAGKWQRLIYILDAMETGGGEMAEPAKAALARWISDRNRSYAVASKAQLQEIAARMERLGSKLPADMRRQLAFLLR